MRLVLWKRKKKKKKERKEKTHKREPRAISSPFCKLGRPFGSCVLKAWIAFMCSVGLPLISLILTASPSLKPSMPSWEIGFCSKNSLTNSCAYRIVSRYRVGRRSFSVIDCDRSRTRIRCRMIPRCKGVVSRSSL